MSMDTEAPVWVSDSDGILWLQGSPGLQILTVAAKMLRQCSCSNTETQKSSNCDRKGTHRKQHLKPNTSGTYSAVLTNISFCFSLSDLPNEQLSGIKQSHPIPFMLKIHDVRQLPKGSDGDDVGLSVSRCFIQAQSLFGS